MSKLDWSIDIESASGARRTAVEVRARKATILFNDMCVILNEAQKSGANNAWIPLMFIDENQVEQKHSATNISAINEYLTMKGYNIAKDTRNGIPQIYVEW